MRKDNDLKQIKELLEIVKHKVDMMEVSRTGQSASIYLMKDQQSVMNEKLNGIVERLEDPDIGLKRINEVLDANTASVVTIEKEIKAYGDMYKINNSDAKKLEKRVEILEENAGINPPPELTLAEVQ